MKGPASGELGAMVVFLLLSLCLGAQVGGWLHPVPPAGWVSAPCPSSVTPAFLWTAEGSGDGELVLPVAPRHLVRSPACPAQSFPGWEEMALGSISQSPLRP